MPASSRPANAGARDQFAALLPIRERALGSEHPDTLRAHRGLARWTGEAGDGAGPRDQWGCPYVTRCGPTVRTSPRRHRYTIRSTARRPRVSKRLVGRVGLEPTTGGL